MLTDKAAEMRDRMKDSPNSAIQGPPPPTDDNVPGVQFQDESNKETGATDESDKRPLLSDDDFLNVSDWLSTSPPARRYIIEDFLPEDITAVMNSAGGLGKSNLLLLLCICVATGINIAPFKVKKPRKVIMVNVEDSEDDIKRRIYALGQVYPEVIDAKDLIEKNLKCYAGRGKVSTLMTLRNGSPEITPDG